MTVSPEMRPQLTRMEEARRQVQRQLERIDRQIRRRMTALIPGLLPRRSLCRRGKAVDARAFLERYRSQLAALTAERQSEIDAFSQELAQEEQAIATFLDRHGEVADHSDRA